MIKHSHLSFSTAAPCVQARLASPVHPQGTLDAPKILFRVQIYNTSVQPICTPSKKFSKFHYFSCEMLPSLKRRHMPFACFKHWFQRITQHAEGMSLRYGVIVLGDLMQPPSQKFSTEPLRGG